jgi:acyl-CoA thioesterase-1
MHTGRWATRATTYLALVAVVSLATVVGVTVHSRAHPSTGAVPNGGSTPTPTLRVMALGDSITDGYKVPGSYRMALSLDVLGAGRSIDFVGSVQSGPDTFVDRQSEGHPGWRIDEIADIVANRIIVYAPDVVLVLLGTNDMAQGHDVEHAPARLAALIDTIVTTQPGIRVLVGTLPPLADSTLEARAEAFNVGVVAVVAAAKKAGQSVQLVDIHAVVTLNQLFDGMHPGPDGYAAMAQAWFRALRPLLG